MYTLSTIDLILINLTKVRQIFRWYLSNVTLDWDNLTICLASFHDSQLKGGKGVLDIDP